MARKDKSKQSDSSKASKEQNGQGNSMEVGSVTNNQPQPGSSSRPQATDSTPVRNFADQIDNSEMKYSDINNYKLSNVIGNLAFLKLYNLRENSFGRINGVDSELTLNLEVDPRFDLLINQANVFANQVNSIYNVDLYKVLGSNRNFYVNYLQKVYIYSYCKAYFQGNFTSSFADLPTNSNIFIGHAIFMQMLRKQRFSHNYFSDVYVNVVLRQKLDLVTEITKFTTAFPFLTNCFISDNGNNFRYEDSNIERILDGLKIKCYGKLYIIDCKDVETVTQYLLKDSNSLGNSVYVKGSNSWLYTYSAFATTNDINYGLGRSCFISINKDQVVKYMNFYDALDFPPKDIHSKHDVYFVTGMASNFNPQANSDDSSDYTRPLTLGGDDSDIRYGNKVNLAELLEKCAIECIESAVFDRFSRISADADIDPKLDDKIEVEPTADKVIVQGSPIDGTSLTYFEGGTRVQLNLDFEQIKDNKNIVNNILNIVMKNGGHFISNNFKISRNVIRFGDVKLELTSNTFNNISTEEFTKILQIMSYGILQKVGWITETTMRHYLASKFDPVIILIQVNINKKVTEFKVTQNFYGANPLDIAKGFGLPGSPNFPKF